MDEHLEGITRLDWERGLQRNDLCHYPENIATMRGRNSLNQIPPGVAKCNCTSRRLVAPIYAHVQHSFARLGRADKGVNPCTAVKQDVFA